MPNEPGGDDPVVFSTYTPGQDGGWVGFTIADDVPDCSGAGSEAGVVLRALNTYLDVSTDKGQTFKRYDPATIFAKAAVLAGGIWCDQIVYYVRSIDRFVWLIQYRPSATGEGAFRLAVASPGGIKNDATAWTYWDWLAGDFGNATQELDFPDLSATGTNLLVGIDLFDPPAMAGGKKQAAGRLVVRMPLADVAKGGQLGGSYIKFADKNAKGELIALKAHFAQNSTDAALIAGHVDNSNLRVYRWSDGSASTDSHDVGIASWPKILTDLTSIGPDGTTDWLKNMNGTLRFQVLAGARNGSDLWFAWTAGKGDGAAGGFKFPNPHVRMAQIDLNTWQKKDEFQIWNPNYAFAYPALNYNDRGELGMGVAFGGSNDNPDSAFGILGDYVVWYVNGSDKTLPRWGDYIAVRGGSGIGRCSLASDISR